LFNRVPTLFKNHMSMKSKTFIILYTIQVNGEEYARRIQIKATDKEDARLQLTNKLKPNNVEYTIADIIPM